MDEARASRETVLRPPPGRLPARGRWALFLDLDGSLADFTSHPQATVVEAATRGLLERVNARLGGALALLSGRTLATLDELVAPLRLPAAGLHGLERRDGSGRVHRIEPAAGQATAVRREAEAAAARLPGVLLENKGIAFALHYREAPQQEAAVLALAAGIAERHRSGYELQQGALVAELKPIGADKGSALAAFMAEAPFAGRIPVAAGDDWTDEHAFRRADRLGGFGIVVGARRPSAARRALANPAALREWMARIVDA